MQIVPRHPLTSHLQQIGGHLLEAAPVQRGHHIGQIGRPFQEAVGCGQVGHHVPLRHILAAVGERGGLHLLDPNRRELQLGVDRLQRLRGLPTHGDRIGLAHRTDPAVHLHIALDDGPVVEILGVKVAAAEHVVAVFHLLQHKDEAVAVGHGECRRLSPQWGPPETEYIAIVVERRCQVAHDKIGGRADQSGGVCG